MEKIYNLEQNVESQHRNIEEYNVNKDELESRVK